MTSTDELCGGAGIEMLTQAAFGDGVRASIVSDVGRGRGVFSDVYRLQLEGSRPGLPETVVAKLPTTTTNRGPAATSGAYRREADAYRHLLPCSPVRTPHPFAVVTADDTAAFLLEDLTTMRAVDQLSGLQFDDARSVTGTLRSFHEHWRPIVARPDNGADNLGVRRSTVAGFTPGTLERGLEALDLRWAAVDRDLIRQFQGLVANGPRLVEAFNVAAGDDSADTGVTLCHGDPRADNLCFAPDGGTILYDWQQVAIQFAEADLAWLLATSLTPDVRRANESALIEHYGADPERYRLGLVLPGMAALLLAQRQADHERTRRFIAASLTRIGTALADHGVPSMAS